jgi:hypothetical protein
MPRGWSGDKGLLHTVKAPCWATITPKSMPAKQGSPPSQVASQRMSSAQDYWLAPWIGQLL